MTVALPSFEAAQGRLVEAMYTGFHLLKADQRFGCVSPTEVGIGHGEKMSLDGLVSRQPSLESCQVPNHHVLDRTIGL